MRSTTQQRQYPRGASALFAVLGLFFTLPTAVFADNSVGDNATGTTAGAAPLAGGVAKNDVAATVKNALSNVAAKTSGAIAPLAKAPSGVAATSPAAPPMSNDEAARLIANAHKLHIDRWQDKTKVPKAVVVAVHGTTQHAGSFGVLAQNLASKGFIFIGLDLRGHGERFYTAYPGQPNRRVDYEKSADDLGSLLKKVHATYPKLPVFCIGESVGAAVTTHCAGRYPGLMNGIILCSPGTRPRNFNPFMVVPDFVKGVSHLDVPMDVSKYIDEYSSDDKRVSDEMIADPLSRIKLTPKEILRTAFFIRTTPKAAREVASDVPVLIVQGEEDGIVSRKSTKAILKNLPSEHKELVEFKDAGHVLLGTSYLKPQVVNSVSKWLSDQTELQRPKVIGLHNSPKDSQPQ